MGGGKAEGDGTSEKKKKKKNKEQSKAEDKGFRGAKVETDASLD